MNIEVDLERIALAEARLRFAHFDAELAWEIGSRIRRHAYSANLPIAIDVTLARAPLFYTALSGATPDNSEWIRRKKNVVERFHKSSYAVSLEMQQKGTTLEARTGAPFADYVAAGGSFPIRIGGSQSVLGSVTVSGLPQREDHQLVVRTLADVLGQDASGLVLD